jgi:dihydrofolate reductase
VIGDAAGRQAERKGKGEGRKGMSRRLRYHVAVSLDGFIAGPGGEYDWIVADPAIDFAAIYKQFDTAVMGRKTYDVMKAQGGDGSIKGLDVIVFSRTLNPSTRKGIRITNEDPCEVVAALKAESGRDIWLFGGGDLLRTLLDAGLVDTVEPAVIPVLIGSGVPLVAAGEHTKLVLADQRVLPGSGIVALAYSVAGSKAAAPSIDYVRATKPRVKKTGAAGRKTGRRSTRTTKAASRRPQKSR